MKNVAIALVAICTAGCSSTNLFKVSESKNGIPFFPLETFDKTVFTVEEQWAELAIAVSVKRRGAPTTEAPIVMDATLVFDDVSFAQRLHNEFVTASTPALAWTKHAECLETGTCKVGSDTVVAVGTPSVSPPTQLDDAGLGKRKLVGVERSQEQRPSKTALYLNVVIPYGGTGTNTVKLSEKGTLTEVSGSATDTLGGALPGKLLDTLVGPASALLGNTALFGNKLLSAEDNAEIVKIVSTMKRQSRRYIYKLVRPVGELESSCSLLIEVQKASSKCEVSISVVDGGQSTSKDAGNAIKFEGAVVLPTK